MKNYGLILDPIVADKDYVFGGYGALDGQVLQEDGQWLEYIPEGESQLKYGFDPQGCVSFGTLSACEILEHRIYGDRENYSDRFLATLSETTPKGNSPQKVAETLRKTGVPHEDVWPTDEPIDTWAEFYQDPPKSVKTLAQAFIAKFEFKHEYVPTSPASLKNALKYSPLGISVSAWRKRGDLYVSEFDNNHWVVLVGYKDNEYWIVYDSYADNNGEFIKKLAWDYNFQQAKRYKLTLQVERRSQSWFDFLINLFKAAWELSGKK